MERRPPNANRTDTPFPATALFRSPRKGTGRAQEFAAIDLGSNSFHLLVARRDGNELRVIDRMRDSVRLASGLRADRHLSPPVAARALACLRLFGERQIGSESGRERACKCG